MRPTTVDAFIEARVLPEFRPIVAMIRKMMKEHAPSAKEAIAYGIPVYKARRIIAVISPTKRDITLSFSRGAALEDKYRLLQGVGKVSKYVKFKSLADANKVALRYYIRQALELDAQ